MLPWRSHVAVATAGLVLVLPVVVGVILGGYPGGVAGVVSGFLVYDFAYIPPYNTLTVGDGQNWVALGVYVVVMLLVAQVAAHLRTARSAALRREEEARRLFALSELLVENGSLDELLETIVTAIDTVFDVDGVALLLPGGGRLAVAASAGQTLSAADLAAVEPEAGVLVRVGIAGGLQTLVLAAASGPVGLLAFRGLSASAADGALLRTFVNHAALALERVQLRTQAQRTRLLEEVDQVDLVVHRQPRHRTDVGVGVPVHVAGGPHVDLDDRKALRRQSAFTSGFGPDAGDHVDDVDSGREKRPVPGPVRRVAPGMVDAQNAHAVLSRTSQ